MFIASDTQERLFEVLILSKYSDVDMFILVLLVTENWKQSKYLKIEAWLDKLWIILQ